MNTTIIFLSAILLVAAAYPSEYYGHHEEYSQPKIIKIIKPVHVIKVVKHIPPPVPVIKYIKLFHSTTVGHPISLHHHHHDFHHHGHHFGHGW